MTTTPISFGRSMRPALLAVLSATLLAACGGGDTDELDATAAADPGSSQSVNVEAAQAHVSRTPFGDWRRAPICLDSPQACPPSLPPTH